MNQRERSRSYPGWELEPAVEGIRTISRSIGSGPHTREALSGALGSPAITGSSARKLAALTAYGLTVKVGDNYKLSELALRIVKPLQGEELELYRTAFRNSKFFMDVIGQFAPDGALPSQLDVVLERRFNIAVGAGTLAARVLRNSARYAEIIDAEGKIIQGTEKDDGFDNTVPESKPEGETHTPHPSGNPDPDAQMPQLTIELPNPAVRFTCPRKMSKSEKDRVASWIEKVVLSQFEFLVEEDFEVRD